MTTATIILDPHDMYVGEDNQLPSRPEWDKEFLSNMVSKNLISQEGFYLLPLGMQVLSTITHGEPELPITIREIAGLTDMLIVVRSYMALGQGKRFRLDNFKRVAKSGQIEIYFRR